MFAELPAAGAVRGWCAVDQAFAEWKPYTNPKTKQSGWISAGGRVRYDRPPETAEQTGADAAPARRTGHAGVDAALHEFHAAPEGSLARAVLDAALTNAGVDDPHHPPAALDLDHKQVAGRLVAGWLEGHRLGKGDQRHTAPIERALAAAGVARVGEPGGTVPFDGKWHEADGPVTTGEPVRVTRPGWQMPDPSPMRPDGVYRLAPAKVTPVASHAEAFAEGRDVAPAGADGRRAADLLKASQDAGTALLAEITGRAVERLLSMPQPQAVPVLFDDAELEKLRDSLAATIATADLLGRSRVRERARLADVGGAGARTDLHPILDSKGRPWHMYGPATFAEADPLAVFADGIPAQPPAAAVDYFRGLVPTLGTDPYRYGPLLERHAFTLAVAADQVILKKVKEAIAARLLGTADVGTGPADVQAVLDAAGVSPKNPQYAEMVYRTNMMDGYNQGAAAELQTPDMQEFFPVWRYEGVNDSRAGEDHKPHFGKYYPASAAFADVRGPRVYNCRCSFVPVSKYDWADLQKAGARVESRW